ncbi:hypothetical protein DMC01_02060 [Campylobacter troglodytis]|nr:hypothetical protein DMC01_02060 [Campylobacter troglodytis]
MNSKATMIVDYSKYSFERLFKELNSTSEKIAKLNSQKKTLQNKKAKIKHALKNKPKIPTDKTKEALLHSHTVLKTRNYDDFERLIESE